MNIKLCSLVLVVTGTLFGCGPTSLLTPRNTVSESTFTVNYPNTWVIGEGSSSSFGDVVVNLKPSYEVFPKIDTALFGAIKLKQTMTLDELLNKVASIPKDATNLDRSNDAFSGDTAITISYDYNDVNAAQSHSKTVLVIHQSTPYIISSGYRINSKNVASYKADIDEMFRSWKWK